MLITIKAHTKAKQNKVEVTGEQIHVWTTAVPEKGEANKAIIKLLSKYYHTSQSNIRLLKGITNKTKTFEVLA